MDLRAEEEFAVEAIAHYYNLLSENKQLPEIVGICDYCGKNIVLFEVEDEIKQHCLTDKAFKELLNRIIKIKKNGITPFKPD